jgi:hypothetical protein
MLHLVETGFRRRPAVLTTRRFGVLGDAWNRTLEHLGALVSSI